MPFSATEPESGRSSLNIMRERVDLPDPDSPIIENMSGLSFKREKLTSLTATISLPDKSPPSLKIFFRASNGEQFRSIAHGFLHVSLGQETGRGSPA